jgi:hypothetical protein
MVLSAWIHRLQITVSRGSSLALITKRKVTSVRTPILRFRYWAIAGGINR